MGHTCFWATLGAEVRSTGMKVLLVIAVVMVVAGTLWADYRWRRWLAARKRGRKRENDRDVN
jgi:hypothetical protein